MGSQSSEISIQPTTFYKYQTFLLLLHLSFPDRLNPKKISSSLQWRSVNDARSFSLSLSLIHLGPNQLRYWSWKVMYGGIGLGFGKAVMSCGRHLHTKVSRDGATETLKRRVTELEKIRRSKKKSKKKTTFLSRFQNPCHFLTLQLCPWFSLLLELHSLQSYSWWYVVTFRF